MNLMRPDFYFDECEHCINKEYNDDLVCCLSNRLSLAWYRVLLELPIVNRFVDKHKYCQAYEKQ